MLGAINLKHKYLEETTETVMGDAIFWTRNDNSIVTFAVHTSGSNSQALKAI